MCRAGMPAEARHRTRPARRPRARGRRRLLAEGGVRGRGIKLLLAARERNRMSNWSIPPNSPLGPQQGFASPQSASPAQPAPANPSGGGAWQAGQWPAPPTGLQGMTWPGEATRPAPWAQPPAVSMGQGFQAAAPTMVQPTRRTSAGLLVGVLAGGAAFVVLSVILLGWLLRPDMYVGETAPQLTGSFGEWDIVPQREGGVYLGQEYRRGDDRVSLTRSSAPSNQEEAKDVYKEWIARQRKEPGFSSPAPGVYCSGPDEDSGRSEENPKRFFCSLFYRDHSSINIMGDTKKAVLDAAEALR